MADVVHKYGELDQHDMQASSFQASVEVGTGAYNKNVYSSAEVDVDVGDSMLGYQLPTMSGGPDNAIQLRNSTAWQVVDQATVSITTGVSWLWINTIIQYIWMPFTAGVSWGHQTHFYAPGPNPTSAFGANVQFAIRLDGEIVKGALTGHRSMRHRERQAIRATPERRLTPLSIVVGPGPQQPKSHHAVGCGPEAMPVRIFGAVPVTPGGHTVELVARRAPKSFDHDSPWYDSASDFIGLFSRKMLVTEFPTWPQATVASASLQVDAFEENDLLSAATLGTNRMAAITNRYNAIQEGAIARGGLRREHLPGLLLAYGSAYIDDIAYNGRVTDCRYPGWNATGIFGAVRFGAMGNGWWRVDDSTGVTMRAVQAGGGNFDSSVPSLILILANINIRQISRDSCELEPALFAMLGIGQNTVALGDRVIRNTQIIVNNWNVLNRNENDNALAGYVEYDVALMAVIDNRQLAYAGSDWQNFFLVVSGFRPAVPDRVDVTWRNANMTVLQLRPG